MPIDKLDLRCQIEFAIIKVAELVELVVTPSMITANTDILCRARKHIGALQTLN